MTKNSSRHLLQDLLLGFRGRCPKCGEGRMFKSYLKVADNCPVCRQELHHHRADDFPAYIVVSIVGHIMLSAALWIELTFAPAVWLHLAILLPLGMAMTLALLQPVKGVIVALQWRMGMEGFAPNKSAPPLTFQPTA
jgi:uncharacterized protein (DUF983 family)